MVVILTLDFWSHVHKNSLSFYTQNCNHANISKRNFNRSNNIAVSYYNRTFLQIMYYDRNYITLHYLCLTPTIGTYTGHT